MRYTTLSKKYPTLFFPVVSSGERARKLSVVVEGTFMRMHDFLLPHSTELCSPQLDQMYPELSWKYPALINRKWVLLQEDNASLYTVRKTKEKL
jgi:hypothetical protein